MCLPSSVYVCNCEGQDLVFLFAIILMQNPNVANCRGTE